MCFFLCPIVLVACSILQSFFHALAQESRYVIFEFLTFFFPIKFTRILSIVETDILYKLQS